ncbi:MAG: hypothetical protein CMK07_13990 [Ponticaulis sp.]|nr:hypothetical protein [Ponticaulis sp.]
MAGGTDFTANLSLPYLLSNQAQKHVTLNESLRALDGLVQASVVSRGLATPPASPNDGDRYLVAAGATDDWAGQEGDLALYVDGGWLFFTPQAGWRVWIEGEARFQVFDGSDWRETTSDELQNLVFVGLGGTADASNPLLAKLNACLFTALETGNGGSGDLRAKFNKESSGNILSLLFQTGYSSRAEIGLVGDDDLVLKVSPDGSTFYEGLKLDNSSGRACFPNGSDDFRERLTADRTYYVDASTGSDSNTGLSSGAAFATINHALSVAYGLDLSGYDVTIQCADGTYSENVSVDGALVGRGLLTLRGNTSLPGNCVIQPVSDAALTARNRARLSVEGFDFQGVTRHVDVDTGAKVTISNAVNFSACSQYHLIADGPDSEISCGADYTVSGGAQYHWRSTFGAFISVTNMTLTISGAGLAFTRFASGLSLAIIYCSGITFAGDHATVTGQRYRVDENSVIRTGGGGATYLPGSASGATATGGQYT